jgi:hypothetical protein
MSDVLQGAIIGVAGAIVGALITAVIAYINTKSQLNFRIYELRTERLIKSRTDVLLSLGKTLNIWSQCSSEEMKLMVQMGEANKNGNTTEITKSIERWYKMSEKRDEARFDMKVLVGQLSDSQLLKMIKEVEEAQTNENSKIIEITTLAHKPESLNVATMKKLNKEATHYHDITLSKVIPLNKRIEELLSGEPAD